MNLIACGLIGLGLLILAHHWYTTGKLVDLADVLNHEFFVCLCIALGVGGLIL